MSEKVSVVGVLGVARRMTHSAWERRVEAMLGGEEWSCRVRKVVERVVRWLEEGLVDLVCRAHKRGAASNLPPQ